ncbi:MAG TPA: lactaldehyde reductase [Candidatus Faecenecus gallistercoris]|uniref:Lactaldehyde reductase n=1 Tax=Candidatus Faecenecus gallistercoris TaxID=2840793 RepID=A0A9D0Z0Z0_9FIRM|nr:lactaldehyde reductase [Candidatus Faecenecus gallistercoris]
MQRIILNGTSYFGPHAREVLPTEVQSRGFKRILVVTDASLVSAGVVDKVLEELDSNYIPYEVFSDVKPNPTVAEVQEGVKKCQQMGADCIVAIGGGSAIDTAKAIGVIMTNPEYSDVVSLDGACNTKNPCLPIFALPTTAGTAAEVTINYVITDPTRVKKMVCVDPHDIPIVAIVDTELMASMPASLASATGMDALTHAMEGYITKAAWDMTDMFHLKAMSIIYQNLPKAVLEHDMDAINNMGVAQYIAGMGFSNVGLGIVHSMAHQLGAVYDTPHGLANAVLLPYVMRYNGEVCPDRFVDMGRAFGLDMNGVTGMDAVMKVVNAIQELNQKLGIPAHLKEVGVKEEDIPMLSEKAMNDVCTGGNPRETSVADIEKIYREAF